VIRLLTMSGVSLAAAVLLAGAPARALTVAAESVLICPAIEDFRMVAAGQDVAACARVEKNADLYGPIGRADTLPGGPFVRVRHGKTLYWAEENAFYLPSAPAGAGAVGLSGAAVPLPPAK
jgi:hypothetical protein